LHKIWVYIFQIKEHAINGKKQHFPNIFLLPPTSLSTTSVYEGNILSSNFWDNMWQTMSRVNVHDKQLNAI